MNYQRELLFGRWYRDDLNPQGFQQSEYAELSADGSFELTFLTLNAVGDVTEQIVELGDWGLVGDIHFTITKSEFVHDQDYAADMADDYSAWTVGGTLVFGGFEAMAQYSDSESDDTEWNQYLVQAGYRFAGTTLVSAQYAELEDDSSQALRAARYGDASDDTIEKWTVGVYHDVNANLKLIAEYTSVEDDVDAGLDQDIYSLGAFVFF